MSFLPLSESPGVLSCNYISGQKCCQKILTCCGVHDKWVAYVLKIHSRNSSSQRTPHVQIHTQTHTNTRTQTEKQTNAHISDTHKQPYTQALHTLQSTRISNRPRPSIIYIRVCLLLCHRLFGWSKPIRTTKDFCVRLYMYIAAALE